MSRNSVLEGNSSGVQTVRETQGHILDVALRLMQTGGYHAFSYADIAAEVDITKASVHYHYPAKADLGQATLRHYRAWWRERLQELHPSARAAAGKTFRGVPGAGATAPANGTDAALRGYSRVYRDMLRGGRLCLAAALAQESPLLPAGMQAELRGFYSEHEDWLAGVLEEGREMGTVTAPGPLRVQARALLSSLHGAQGLARVQGDVYLYCAVAHLTLSGLGLPFSDLEIIDPAAFEATAFEAEGSGAQETDAGVATLA